MALAEVACLGIECECQQHCAGSAEFGFREWACALVTGASLEGFLFAWLSHHPLPHCMPMDALGTSSKSRQVCFVSSAACRVVELQPYQSNNGFQPAMCQVNTHQHNPQCFADTNVTHP
jgi:hypothetical protein